MRIGVPALITLACVISPLTAAQSVDFDRDVRPILSDNCYQCHGPDEAVREAGIRLDTKDAVFAPREAGAVVVPGRPSESLLIQRVFAEDPSRVMPPQEANRPLSDADRETLRRWIAGGAEWSEHWAFEPPGKSLPPTVRDPDWIRNPIDNFIAARLDSLDLSPAQVASPTTLLRRLSLDITGLPPSEQDTALFLSDTSPAAYENLVDRLLASRHYGERMAWPWLDAARYADTNGYQGDNERTMYPWRDWVIRAFNDNMPYDRFTIWQLAGDLLPEATFEQKLATGFSRNHMINGEGGRIAEENRVEYVFDQLETVGTVWMGLTFNCCRCHDHKYDPLTNKDYYSFSAFFNQTPVDGGGGDPKTRPNLAINSVETDFAIAQLNADLKQLESERKIRLAEIEPKQAGWERETLARAEIDELFDSEFLQLLAIPPDQRDTQQASEIAAHYVSSDETIRDIEKRFEEKRERRDSIVQRGARVMIMEDMPEPRKTFMLDRGVYSKRGEEVYPDVPQVLPAMSTDAPGNRLGLAEWLVDPANPLTARVTVNRFWSQVFGQGLVRTNENFGVQGEAPTHPELLDWLAVTFVESGWDVKALLRLILASATYRQSSQVDPDLLETDPQNRLLARGSRYRMPSWMIRDQALHASGIMVDKLGGRPVKPYQPQGLWEEFSFGNIKYTRDSGEDLYRRSLYTYWRRIVGPPVFFDAASRQTCTVNSTLTNTPLHALVTLNDTAYVEAGRALAARLLRNRAESDEQRITEAYRRILARPATREELDLLLSGLRRLRSQFAANSDAAVEYLSVGEWTDTDDLDPVEHAAWSALCLTLFNTDEALTKG